MKLGTAALLLALGALAGCNKTNASILIEETCAPPKPDATSGGCVWDSGTCSATPLDTYWIDLSYGLKFFLGVQVDNQLTNNADATLGQVNTHDAFVDTYSVTYATAGAPAGTSVPAITAPPQIQNTVPAAGSAVIGINPIDGDALAALMTAAQAAGGASFRVIATVKLHGYLGDGSSFQSEERKYPIDVCWGCVAVPVCTGTKVLHSCPDPIQWPSNSSCDSST